MHTFFYVRSERTPTQRKLQSAIHYVKSIPSIIECTVRRAMRASSDLLYHQETHLEAYFVAPFSLGRGKPPNGGSVCNSPFPPLTDNGMLQPDTRHLRTRTAVSAWQATPTLLGTTYRLERGAVASVGWGGDPPRFHGEGTPSLSSLGKNAP